MPARIQAVIKAKEGHTKSTFFGLLCEKGLLFQFIICQLNNT